MTAKRLVGLDLFKILAMLGVVMLHILGRGGVQEACASDSHSVKYLCEQIFYTAIVSAVDCFVLASGFIMRNRRWKISRLVMLWLQVVFYGLFFAVLAILFFPEIGIGGRGFLEACFPITFDRLWFFTQYVALFLTMPVLNIVIERFSSRQMMNVCLVGFVVLSLFPTLVGHDVFRTSGGYSYLWFMYLYLVGAMVSKYRLYERIPSWVCFGASCALILISVGLGILYGRLLGLGGVWQNYTSPTVLAEGVFFMMGCCRLNISSPAIVRIITWIGPFLFSVYAIHSQSVFRLMIKWNGLYSPVAKFPTIVMILTVFSCATIIFMTCVGIDYLRSKIFKFQRVGQLMERLDRWTGC